MMAKKRTQRCPGKFAYINAIFPVNKKTEMAYKTGGRNSHDTEPLQNLILNTEGFILVMPTIYEEISD